jgi:hypothetical protein
MLPDCSKAQVRVSQRDDGQWLELFTIGDRAFINHIDGPASASKTTPDRVMFERGLCDAYQQTATPAAAPVASVSSAVETSDPMTAAVVVIGSLVGLVAVILGGVVMSYILKPDPTISLPKPKALLLPPPTPDQGIYDPMVWDRIQGAETQGIRGEFDPSSPVNSPVNSSEFDPNSPIQPGEFEAFLALTEMGVNPRSNEMLQQMWGVKPGKSSAYMAARDRRDTFCRRLSEFQS